jgi:predicted permease
MTSRKTELPAFRALLRLYPGEFRDEYGREMALVLSDRYREAANSWERALISIEAITGVLSHAPKEHFSMILRDLRYALRLLRKSPAFTVTAILSLGIGIGANTAIFAVAKKVLFDTLPVKDPQQLRMLTWVSGHEQPVPPVWGDVYSTKEGGLASTAFSYPVLRELRKKNEVFQDLIAFKDVEMTATVDGHPELIAGEMLSGNAFRALGVQPILGRALTLADDAGPGTAPAALISEGYWAERFSRSASVLGKTISLNGAPVTVVGVTSAQFTGLTMGSIARVFVPLSMQPLLMPRAQGTGSGSLLENPQSWWVLIMARLRADVPEARTRAVLNVVLRQTTIATLPAAKGLDQFHLRLQPGDRGLDYLNGFTKPSYVLVALAGLVLLLACVNLANLLLARAAARQREMSTRLALGAGRACIFRQLLTESLLLSSLGGMAGLVLSYLGRNIIPRLLTDSWRPASVSVDFDWRVLLFAVGVSLLTGIVFGAVPIWQAMRTDVSAALKDGSHATMGRRKAWVGKGLVVLQVAISTILLIGAGLFVRTLVNLSHTPLGFRADHILLFKLNPPRTRYTDEQMIALYRQLEGKFAAIPGVRSVTFSDIALIGDGHSGSTFHVSGRPVRNNEERVQTNGVGVDFFQTMGIPILQGRSFDAHDNARSRKVAMVNRALVRQFFPNENPIGQTFECEDTDGPVQIVGIVPDTRYAELRNETPPTFYVPYQQRSLSSRMIVEMHTAVEPFSVLNPVRTAVESLDRDLPLIDVRTQEQQIAASLSSERIFAQLTSGFGIVALALACVGIYGLMAYTVARRTGEIGIRMALGAGMEQVLAGVLLEALWMSIAGVTLGIGASFWLARFIGSMLYGLKATDPITAGGTAALLICITLLAGMGPARRASHVDPLSALRHE